MTHDPANGDATNCAFTPGDLPVEVPGNRERRGTLPHDNSKKALFPGENSIFLLPEERPAEPLARAVIILK
jgi:hypothetical protein